MEEIYRREGVVGAAQKMMANTSADLSDREPDLELSQPTAQRTANLAFFYAHDAPAVRRYRLDLAALAAAPTRIVAAAGVASRETWVHHCADALADRLGSQVIEFPGVHNGYIFHPKGFTLKLREVLGDNVDA